MKSVVNDTASQSATAEQTFIDQPELLRRLGICRKSAQNWERAGKLPVVKVFRKKLYHWPSVEAALLRHHASINKS